MRGTVEVQARSAACAPFAIALCEPARGQARRSSARRAEGESNVERRLPFPPPRWLGGQADVIRLEPDNKANLTKSPYLKIASSDTNILGVDAKNSVLIGKKTGQAEIRISFSEATAIVKAFVKEQKND